MHDKIVEIFQELKILNGVILHTGESLKIQIEVLKMFLVTHPHFTGLTVNEIRHAFYLNSQGEYEEVYRHYNKELNAEFIGDVLRAYVRYKNGIYRLKGKSIKAILNPVEVKPPVMPTEQEYRQMIQQHYENFLAGRRDLVFIAESTYRMLRKYGAILIKSREHYKKLIQQALEIREQYAMSSLLQKDAKEKENILRLRGIYKVWRAEGWIPIDEYRMVIYTVRKRLCFRFFETMQYFNIKEIFKEININH